MNFFFIHLPEKKREDEFYTHRMVIAHRPPHDTMEGSEFLDDAIRMKDQPLIYADESNMDNPQEVLL